MNVTEWEKRLRDAFANSNASTGVLLQILNAESNCGLEHARQFKGQALLVECFQQFFIESIGHVKEFVLAGEQDRSYTYRSIVARHKANFQSIRASQVCFDAGYGYHAFGLLRGIRENTLQLCGLMRGLTSESELAGLPLEDDPSLSRSEKFERAKKRGQKAESLLYQKLLGAQSAVPTDVQLELHRVKYMFDDELHRFRLSQTDDIEWLKGVGALTFGPSASDDGAVLYMNRLDELCWMMLRTLPSLQPEGIRFPADWAEKWHVLDASLQHCVEALTVQLGKEIGVRISDFIKGEFQFDPSYQFRTTNI